MGHTWIWGWTWLTCFLACRVVVVFFIKMVASLKNYVYINSSFLVYWRIRTPGPGVRVFSVVVSIWNWVKIAPFKRAPALGFTTFLPFPTSLHMAGHTQSFSWLSLEFWLWSWIAQLPNNDWRKMEVKYRFNTRKNI